MIIRSRRSRAVGQLTAIPGWAALRPFRLFGVIGADHEAAIHTRLVQRYLSQLLVEHPNVI
jgi:hypothetical protein